MIESVRFFGARWKGTQTLPVFIEIRTHLLGLLGYSVVRTVGTGPPVTLYRGFSFKDANGVYEKAMGLISEHL